jgi:ech hydrogenase subunit D
MIMENLFQIEKEQILATVQEMLHSGYRFVTATCVDNGDDTVDVIYHFGKDMELRNYKVTVKKGGEVPSISKIYFCALLVENEMKELFDINVKDIIVDYDGHLILSDEELTFPMGKQITVVQKGEKKNG